MRHPVARLLAGSTQTIAGTVYGTIVVMAALVAGVQGFQHDLWRLAVLVVTTAFVFWLAHVYSDGLGESLERGRRLDTREFAAIARREFSILLAVVAPTAALLLGAVGVVRDTAAVWLAVGAGVATLAIQGVRYAHVERLGPLGTLVALAVNVGLGLALVALKVFVAH
jgi:uncharacterized ion transporter superfamily protein YfcC